jgi:chromosome segregation ATPase
MLNRTVLIVFICMTAVAAAGAQSRDSDSQTLHEILLELRAIHEDMRVTETTQLLVAELEMQQGVVTRAMESADTARARIRDIRLDEKRLTAEIEQAEEQKDKATNPDEKNSITQDNERRKANLDNLKSIEREANTTLQDMEQRLQNAQDKLASIESELNSALSRLGPVTKDAAAK